MQLSNNTRCVWPLSKGLIDQNNPRLSLFGFHITFSGKPVFLKCFSVEENGCMGKADHQLLPREPSKRNSWFLINVNELVSWVAFRLSSAVHSLYSRRYRIYVTERKRVSACSPTKCFCYSGVRVEAELGCAGPYPELQEDFIDTEAFKEDFKHPMLCCNFINICLHQEKLVELIFS